jgi:hypothetical protein
MTERSSDACSAAPRTWNRFGTFFLAASHCCLVMPSFHGARSEAMTGCSFAANVSLQWSTHARVGCTDLVAVAAAVLVLGDGLFNLLDEFLPVVGDWRASERADAASPAIAPSRYLDSGDVEMGATSCAVTSAPATSATAAITRSLAAETTNSQTERSGETLSHHGRPADGPGRSARAPSRGRTPPDRG